MDTQEVGLGGMDWIDRSQDTDRWRAVVKAVMNIYNTYYHLVVQCFYLLLLLLRCVSDTGLCHLQGPHKFIDVCSLCVSLCGRDATAYSFID